MIIHASERTLTGDSLTVSARIKIQKANAQVPDALWFRVPAQYAGMVSERADAFVSALLFIALHFGEDIEVRSTLSPRFALGLEQEYQHAFVQWFPDRFRPVRVQPEGYAVTETAGTGRLAAFSGGVDSFYTLYKLRPECEHRPGLALTHTLNLAGFDVLLKDVARWQQIQSAQQAIMARVGVGYIPMASNIRHFTDALLGWEAWNECHGAVLTGAALLLEPGFERFYFPSSHSFSVRPAWGSTAGTDPLLSTERMQIFHYGSGTTRFRKTLAIAEWPETYDHLRVCWKIADGMDNCCRCQICVRTMLALTVAGALPEYSTFKSPLDFDQLPPDFHEYVSYLHPETIEGLLTAGRPDLAKAYRRALRPQRSWQFWR